MEEVFKNCLGLSSPNSSSPENKENESENQRNARQMGTKSQHKNKQMSPKNFMAPTISAASKTTSPKRKIILADLKDDSKKKKAVISSLSPNRKSLPKIPPLSSPKVLESNYYNEDDTFVPDPSSTRAYDPLTNYLSPRPKYLRYNPNRRRKAFLHREREVEPCISPSVSLDYKGCFSVSYAAESSLKQEKGGNESNEEKEEEIDEEEDENEDEEAMIEEKDWGLKWRLFKCLIVFSVLVFSTKWISSMNSPTIYSDVKGFKNEGLNFENITSRAVSLRNHEFGTWVFGMRGESMLSQYEIEFNEVIGFQEIEIAEKKVSLEDYLQLATPFEVENDPETILESSKDREDENKVLIVAQALDQKIEKENMVSDLVSKNGQVENEVIVVGDPNETTQEEDMVVGYGVEIVAEYPYTLIENEHMADCVENMDESDLKFNHLENEVEIEVTNMADYVENMDESESKFDDRKLENEVENEKGNLADYVENMDESESKFDDRKLENEVENEKGNLAVYVEKNIEYEPKSNHGQLENKVNEDLYEGIEEEILVENEENERLDHQVYNQIWRTPKNVIGLVISSLTLVALYLVARFYVKCKKASSKTISSNLKKLCSQAKMVEKSNLRLPPKAGDEVEKIKKADMNLNPPSFIGSSEERNENIPPRIIPKVEMLGEFVVGREFSSLLKSCNMKTKPRESEETNHSVIEDRRTSMTKAARSIVPSSLLQLSTCELSTADSFSQGSYISHEKTARKEIGEEVSKTTPTLLRRSSRIRNRGVTSP